MTQFPATCQPKKTTGELPSWARGGFSPGASVPYVLGDRGDIVAILLGDPLHSPPLPGRQSKILWIGRPAPATAIPGSSPDLLIEAKLDNSSQEVTRTVSGGPGSSIIDMPAPGCWNLRLTWSGHTDSMAITYLGS